MFIGSRQIFLPLRFFVLIILVITSAAIFIVFQKNDINESNYISISEYRKGVIPADDWFARQRAFPFDEIPHEEYLSSIDYVKNEMSFYEMDYPAGWTLVGPTNIEGRVTCLAIHPVNPQIIYTGTANGGLWKSTNFCQSWVSVFDNQNTSSIGALAIDPQNPLVIYCGTGEANSLRSYYPGTGIYKSTDGGESWSLSGLDSSFTIGNISINPFNSNEVYVAAGGWTRRKNPQRGIYKSSDAGQTWQRKLFISDSVSAIDVLVDPNNGSRIYGAMWERLRREDYIKYGGQYSGLFVSTNSGENWTQLGGGFPVNDATLGRISLDISKANSQIIYALTAAANGNSRGLYKSTNWGGSWTLINASAAPSSNYAWFNRICKADPSNAEKLFCGGLNMYLSTNGGTGFSTIAESHVDHHAVAFAPSNSNYIAVGNDGGIDYSTNGGSTWLYSNSLPITQFYAGDIDFSNPSVLMGGAQDNGTNKTTGSVGGWFSVYGGDGFYCLVDYTNSQRVYASSQNGGLVRSINGGSSFSGATSGLDLNYTNWMTPYVMDKNNPLVLYCGTYKIHKTTNGMQSWTPISPDLANGHRGNLGTITTVDVSKSNPNVVYCGTDDANVWVTTNGGTNWTKINSGLPYRWVTRVAIHPDSANVCYVTLSGYKVDSTGSHIFRTSNYGATWFSIRGNLPDAPVNDIIIDPANTNVLYIATDVNVMVTENLGSNWNILSMGIPSNVPCHDLTFHQPSRTLVVWTHGRSAYKIKIPLVQVVNNTIGVEKGFILYQNYPNPFNPVTKISYELKDAEGRSSFVSLKVYDVLGNEILTLVNENKKPGYYEVEFSASSAAGKLPSGIYFYKLKAGNIIETKRMILIK
ncbi:MAG: hypothetical protein HGGPFJEG_01836 [Ignavibacteria bacterium]|nr:hypothetical protein [Ignavibacteria bacterium]